jgi:hypothetical protein
MEATLDRPPCQDVVVSTPAPQHCPSPRELDDLELLLNGALDPIRTFNEPGSPVTLALPEEIAAAAEAAGLVELVDPEGLPLAVMSTATGALEARSHAAYGASSRAPAWARRPCRPRRTTRSTSRRARSCCGPAEPAHRSR